MGPAAGAGSSVLHLSDYFAVHPAGTLDFGPVLPDLLPP